MRKILFYRDFIKFTGGHMKVKDYFDHIKHTPGFTPLISFSKRTKWNKSNPWLNNKKYKVKNWDPEIADIFFFGGCDWFKTNFPITDKKNKPIIYIIQDMRHGNESEKLFRYLRNRAIRICVSKELHDYISRSNIVNGPIFTIENGLNYQLFPVPLTHEEKHNDILIVSMKKPKTGRILKGQLQKFSKRVILLNKLIPREKFLKYMNESKITVYLPNFEEGFYLPALEGMALHTLVICPDCIGNRTFCKDNITCLQPHYSIDRIIASVKQASDFSEYDKMKMINNAFLYAQKFNIERERIAFQKILNNIYEIW